MTARDSKAIDAITRVLSNDEDWSMDTLDRIAWWVRWSGRVITSAEPARAERRDGMRVALVSARSGAVIGHRAGCADVARDLRRELCDGPADVFHAASRHAAYLEYNQDFIRDHAADGVTDDDEAYGWPITWKPCAKDLPER